MREEDLVQATLECPYLNFPIRLPFIQMNQLTSELLLTEIERVLQSNEQFVLDHCVQLNITHVSLPKGGTGKRCDYVDTGRFLKDRRSRTMEFYSKRSSYPRRVGVGITRKGESTPTSMRNRRCTNVSTIPGRISDTCDIERVFQRNRLPWTHSREEHILVLPRQPLRCDYQHDCVPKSHLLLYKLLQRL